MNVIEHEKITIETNLNRLYRYDLEDYAHKIGKAFQAAIDRIAVKESQLVALEEKYDKLVSEIRKQKRQRAKSSQAPVCRVKPVERQLETHLL